MPYSEIKEQLDRGGIIVLDGATGTELQRRGAEMDAGAWCGPTVLRNKALLEEIHADYIRAGADVITVNSFASSRLMLAPAGYGGRVEEINRHVVEAALAAREAAGRGRDVLVAGSLSHMTPVLAGTATHDPAGVPARSEAREAFRELAGILECSGVDLIILEMMYRPDLARLALSAALETGLPVWFGLSARRAADGRVIAFDSPEERPLDQVVELIPEEGVDVAGCMHTNPFLLGETLPAIRRRFAGPLMAFPDSGYFEMPDWRFVDVISPERLEYFYRDWVDSGVQVIGGCCGLDVEHIKAANRVREERNSR